MSERLLPWARGGLALAFLLAAFAGVELSLALPWAPAELALRLEPRALALAGGLALGAPGWAMLLGAPLAALADTPMMQLAALLLAVGVDWPGRGAVLVLALGAAGHLPGALPAATLLLALRGRPEGAALLLATGPTGAPHLAWLAPLAGLLALRGGAPWRVLLVLGLAVGGPVGRLVALALLLVPDGAWILPTLGPGAAALTLWALRERAPLTLLPASLALGLGAAALSRRRLPLPPWSARLIPAVGFLFWPLLAERPPRLSSLADPLGLPLLLLGVVVLAGAAWGRR